MKCGIIGLPNVGKSSLFNSLTSLKAPAENYPFCTVEPNIGRVNVPDSRLDKLAPIFEPQKITPATIEFVDIAGLIPGAHKGEGLGNRFLSHIREMDALAHVVRVFKDENISHTQGSIDPLRDIQLIETELLLADIESLEKKQEKLNKLAKSSTEKELKIEFSLTEKLLHLLLKEEKPAKEYTPEKEEVKFFQDLRLLTTKPCLYICNMDEKEWEENQKIDNQPSIKNQTEPKQQSCFDRRGPLLPTKNQIETKKQTPNNFQKKEIEQETKINGIKEIIKTYGPEKVLPLCVSLEAQIAKLEESEKQEFLSVLNLKESGLQRMIKCSYYLLNLITFFTAGKKEIRAWTIPKGSRAPTAGGRIHSDFQKGFISAEVYSFKDIQSAGSEKALKESGKYRQEGKNYVVQDGDVILFRFNV